MKEPCFAITVCMAVAAGPGCGVSGDTEYKSFSGCSVWLTAFCEGAYGLYVFDDGDPMDDVCAAVRSPFGGRAYAELTLAPSTGDGVTRLTASYDDAGRLAEYIADCGRDEAIHGTFTWNAAGRLERYDGLWDIDYPIALEASYNQDGTVAAHENIEDGEPSFRHDLTLAAGRISTIDRVAFRDGSTVRFQFVYEGERLASWSVPEDGTERTFAYDAEGRIVAYEDPIRSITVTWASPTDALVTSRFTDGSENSAEITFDTDGRILRKDFYVEGRGVGSSTWERDDAGRLTELFLDVSKD